MGVTKLASSGISSLVRPIDFISVIRHKLINDLLFYLEVQNSYLSMQESIRYVTTCEIGFLLHAIVIIIWQFHMLQYCSTLSNSGVAQVTGLCSSLRSGLPSPLPPRDGYILERLYHPGASLSEQHMATHIRPAGRLWLHGHGLDFTFNDLNLELAGESPLCMNGHARRLPEASLLSVTRSPSRSSRDRFIAQIYQKVAVRVASAFMLNRLCSRSLSRRRCSLACSNPSRLFSQLS